MGLSHAPRVITDGIVLALDAANTRSYVGSGTTWTDLIGSNNGTLTNGPVFTQEPKLEPFGGAGAVEFDGTGDYLTAPDSSGLLSLPGSFTIELFTYFSTVTSQVTFVCKTEDNSQFAWFLQYIASSGGIRFYPGTGGGIGTPITFAWTPSTGTWYHLALTRDASNNVRMFVDGVQIGNTSTNTDNLSSTGQITIGDNIDVLGTQELNGYISNLRILKGTALYTSDFTPPVHELQPIGDTVLLCCNNPDSAGAEATGKTITINGNAAASTVSPGLTRDFTSGTQFQGVAKFDTQGYFVPPSGTTEQRGRGRGIFGGAYTTPGGADKSIETISLQSGGIAQDFGDMSSTAMMATALGNQTRAVFAGGYSSPVPVDTIEFVEFATQGNAVNFGTLSENKRHMASVASSTKGVWSGGTTTGSTNCVTTLDNVTIAAKGTAVDYGDLSAARRSHGGGASPTRGVFAGGNTNTPTPNLAMQTIDYFTIASGGTALTFGTLTVGTREIGGSSDSTRAVFGGGFTSAITNTIEYVTIATTGNAQDFGDLYVTRSFANGCSSSTRAIFAGGAISPLYSNVIDKVTIQSTGNATDFGDLIQQRLGYANACSDSHGGLS